VKAGNGAFMTGASEADQLARSLVEVANGAGMRTSALITDMNEPLADCAGNVVEIRNCLDFLAGRKAGTRLETAVLAFAAEMLLRSGLAASPAEGEAKARQALASGRAAEIFARMVHLLGGPADLLENPGKHLARAPVERPVPAPRTGWLSACNARGIGMSVIDLGGGRRHPADRIDHRVGFSALLPLGTHVGEGDPIAFVHAADEAAAERAAAALAANYRIADSKPQPAPVILDRL
jgi:thymidine phosphorylase